MQERFFGAARQLTRRRWLACDLYKEAGEPVSIAAWRNTFARFVPAGLCRMNARKILSFLLFWAIAGTCHAQNGAVVCHDGIGNFEAVSLTGVSVQVGAARSEGFARRACEGTLLWEKSKALIASGVTEMDVDAFGIDLGVGTPVATFQVKKAEAECCMSLEIYSLRKPPKLLRTITGGTFFSTADTDLDGQVEIWTNDTASLAGFAALASLSSAADAASAWLLSIWSPSTAMSLTRALLR